MYSAEPWSPLCMRTSPAGTLIIYTESATSWHCSSLNSNTPPSILLLLMASLIMSISAAHGLKPSTTGRPESAQMPSGTSAASLLWENWCTRPFLTSWALSASCRRMPRASKSAARTDSVVIGPLAAEIWTGLVAFANCSASSPKTAPRWMEHVCWGTETVAEPSSTTCTTEHSAPYWITFSSASYLLHWAMECTLLKSSSLNFAKAGTLRNISKHSSTGGNARCIKAFALTVKRRFPRFARGLARGLGGLSVGLMSAGLNITAEAR
mmetsp:Transcript_67664/g.207279  ORF Transcript_67664/g.207279 Transcript_67664/m.207279 type:complete len:267 (+) Transcript_67664:1912-2712(+)